MSARARIRTGGGGRASVRCGDGLAMDEREFRRKVSSVAGYPYGISTTGAKLYEGRDLLRLGVRELDFVLNPAAMISRQFQHVETELMQIVRSAHEADATSDSGLQQPDPGRRPENHRDPHLQTGRSRHASPSSTSSLTCRSSSPFSRICCGSNGRTAC